MSKLQKIAQMRNSFKGRIKGLRNNIRGMLTKEGKKSLAYPERAKLVEIEKDLDNMLNSWDHNWEELKKDI